jgi:hypothetical protein
MLDQSAEVDIVATSGTVRVAVQPKTSWLWLIAAGILDIVFLVWFIREWPDLSLLMRGLLLWAEVSGVASFFYVVSGSETIEFSDTDLFIRRENLGIAREKRYALRDCSDLVWEEATSEQAARMKCKVGWRTIRFATYIDQRQADQILAELQRTLPNIAPQLLGGTDKTHFTTLGLS